MVLRQPSLRPLTNIHCPHPAICRGGLHSGSDSNIWFNEAANTKVATASGQCLATPASSVTTTINANETPTFGIFATASGAVPFDLANNRIFVEFSDANAVVRGSTSVAIETQ